MGELEEGGWEMFQFLCAPRSILFHLYYAAAYYKSTKGSQPEPLANCPPPPHSPQLHFTRKGEKERETRLDCCAVLRLLYEQAFAGLCVADTKEGREAGSIFTSEPSLFLYLSASPAFGGR